MTLQEELILPIFQNKCYAPVDYILYVQSTSIIFIKIV